LVSVVPFRFINKVGMLVNSRFRFMISWDVVLG
jgi:hypothetical protein